MGDEQRQPLLKVYYEGCPGCKVDQLKEIQNGLPVKQILSIWMIGLCAGLPIAVLFPFLYFMIRDLNIAEREEDIGFYAGFLGASFMLGRALTSVLWGIVADRYGRRPVIIFGIFSVVVFNALFGLSVNYWMAITTRFLLGSLNGLIGPMKAYVCEAFLPEYQTLGLAAISTAWGIGLIIGPSLGGFLAQPAEKYPNVFSEDSIFGRFPYFLPCLCVSVFALVVNVFTFWLPETLHFHKESDSEAAPPGPDVNEEIKASQGEKTASVASLFKNWPLMSSILVYCVFSCHDMAYEEIFSLWTESPKKNGGLSYSTDDVGVVLAISGLGLLAFQVGIYPALTRNVGPIMLCRITGVLSIFLLTCYPYMTNLSGFILSLCLTCASVVKNVLAVIIITGLFLLQNNAVDQDQRGAANGIAMTGMSLFKAVGPAVGGAFFSWAQRRQDASFLPGDQLVFFVLNALELLGVFLTFKPFLVERQ